ncbi:hypothetical protein FT663_04028 [Candidozyma haemuli var. vulneris]|uniref:Uncharacterized protein n=1 Tax=Candidozyma haemuli TaxID=45357 RepID=A0A2V1AQW6_9ASCO|nr:hypothetical protein CXQ85_001968 [[Candida] haemuloni]KAF3987241.1 hypothetical protein FT662_04090 [[Candida] haemuloni var. vulneris]KAF3988490.1 hypothetical protein FT663_04028 [[Candida] haemuloni var. vulneris]PVH20185.1 hypothetical protein CXQ85_001968 [[Candida] haemuloni]
MPLIPIDIREYASTPSSSSQKLSKVVLGLIIAGASIVGIGILATIIMCCKRPGLFSDLNYGLHGITISRPKYPSQAPPRPSSRGVIRGPDGVVRGPDGVVREPPPAYSPV